MHLTGTPSFAHLPALDPAALSREFGLSPIPIYVPPTLPAAAARTRSDPLSAAVPTTATPNQRPSGPPHLTEPWPPLEVLGTTLTPTTANPPIAAMLATIPSTPAPQPALSDSTVATFRNTIRACLTQSNARELEQLFQLAAATLRARFRAAGSVHVLYNAHGGDEIFNKMTPLDLCFSPGTRAFYLRFAPHELRSPLADLREAVFPSLADEYTNIPLADTSTFSVTDPPRPTSWTKSVRPGDEYGLLRSARLDAGTPVAYSHIQPAYGTDISAVPWTQVGQCDATGTFTRTDPVQPPNLDNLQWIWNPQSLPALGTGYMEDYPPHVLLRVLLLLAPAHRERVCTAFKLSELEVERAIIQFANDDPLPFFDDIVPHANERIMTLMQLTALRTADEETDQRRRNAEYRRRAQDRDEESPSDHDEPAGTPTGSAAVSLTRPASDGLDDAIPAAGGSWRPPSARPRETMPSDKLPTAPSAAPPTVQVAVATPKPATFPPTPSAAQPTARAMTPASSVTTSAVAPSAAMPTAPTVTTPTAGPSTTTPTAPEEAEDTDTLFSREVCARLHIAPNKHGRLHPPPDAREIPAHTFSLAPGCAIYWPGEQSYMLMTTALDNADLYSDERPVAWCPASYDAVGIANTGVFQNNLARRIGRCPLNDDDMARFKDEKRPIPLTYKATIEQLLKDGLIEPSQAGYGSPVHVVLAPKKDGTMRFCVDYRRLNNLIEGDVFPLPRIDDQLERLQGSSIFSTSVGDCLSGFWQLGLEEASRDYTTFLLPWGAWKWFSARGPPLHHLIDLKAFFAALARGNLKLKPSKCHFMVREIDLLGHRVSAQGVRMDTKKVEVISKITERELQTVEHMRSFLGMTGFYRRFIRNYTRRELPLRDLIHAAKLADTTQLQWTPEASDALADLKKVMCDDIVLMLPDFSKPFIIYTDWSLRAMGAALMQADSDSRERPIAFISRTLTATEARYSSPTEGECIAVMWAVRVNTWRHYFDCGHPFTIRTDHSPLQWLKSQELLANKALSRAALVMQGFNYTIEYRPGSTNVVADFESRMARTHPIYEPGAADGSDLTTDLPNGAHGHSVPRSGDPDDPTEIYGTLVPVTTEPTTSIAAAGLDGRAWAPPAPGTKRRRPVTLAEPRSSPNSPPQRARRNPEEQAMDDAEDVTSEVDPAEFSDADDEELSSEEQRSSPSRAEADLPGRAGHHSEEQRSSPAHDNTTRDGTRDSGNHGRGRATEPRKPVLPDADPIGNLLPPPQLRIPGGIQHEIESYWQQEAQRHLDGRQHEPALQERDGEADPPLSPNSSVGDLTDATDGEPAQATSPAPSASPAFAGQQGNKQPRRRAEDRHRAAKQAQHRWLKQQAQQRHEENEQRKQRRDTRRQELEAQAPRPPNLILTRGAGSRKGRYAIAPPNVMDVLDEALLPIPTPPETLGNERELPPAEPFSTDGVAPLDDRTGGRNAPKPAYLPPETTVADCWMQGPQPLVEVPVPPVLQPLTVDGASMVEDQKTDPLCQMITAFKLRKENLARCYAHTHGADALNRDPDVYKTCFGCGQARERFVNEAGRYCLSRSGAVLRAPLFPKMGSPVVVPQRWRAAVMEAYHDDWAHRGASICIVARRIVTRFWWPGMTNMVHRYVRTCHHCQLAKAKHRPRVQHAHMIIESRHPGDLRQADLCPMPHAKDAPHRFTQVLIDIDAYTKYPEIVMLTEADGTEMEWAAQSIQSSNGTPKRYLTDNGTGMRLIYTGVSHQSTNGGAERLVGVYKRLIFEFALCAEDKHDNVYWPYYSYHYRVLFALRTTIHAATGFSPATLHHGRELVLPGDLRLDLVQREPFGEPYAYAEYALAVAWAASSVAEAVKAHRKMYNQKLLRYGTGNEPRQIFVPGDKVLCWSESAKATNVMKHGTRNGWTGPYVVVEVFSHGYLYTVCGDPSSRMHRSMDVVVHVDNIIPYYDRPDNFAEDPKPGRPRRRAPEPAPPPPVHLDADGDQQMEDPPILRDDEPHSEGRPAEEDSDDDSVESEQEESVQLHVVGWPKHDFA
eukprot:tig00000863_g4961.t1